MATGRPRLVTVIVPPCLSSAPKPKGWFRTFYIDFTLLLHFTQDGLDPDTQSEVGGLILQNAGSKWLRIQLEE